MLLSNQIFELKLNNMKWKGKGDGRGLLGVTSNKHVTYPDRTAFGKKNAFRAHVLHFEPGVVHFYASRTFETPALVAETTR